MEILYFKTFKYRRKSKQNSNIYLYIRYSYILDIIITTYNFHSYQVLGFVPNTTFLIAKFVLLNFENKGLNKTFFLIKNSGIKNIKLRSNDICIFTNFTIEIILHRKLVYGTNRNIFQAETRNISNIHVWQCKILLDTPSNICCGWNFNKNCFIHIVNYFILIY